MKKLADIPRTPQPTRAKSERGEYVERFTDRLNFHRRGTPYHPLSYRQIAVKLAHLAIQDLHAFWNDCDRSGNFSKRFWGALKTAPRPPLNPPTH